MTNSMAGSEGKLRGARSAVFRELSVHCLLLLASVGAAFVVWTGSKPTTDLERGETVIWKGEPEDIERIVFEAPKAQTRIEVKRDAVGTYFLGKYELTVMPGEEVPSPSHVGGMVNQTGKPTTLQQSFVSTKAGLKLVNDLAPLKALRAIGSVPKHQLAEFGLAAPDRRVIVKFRNVERRLEFGDETLGEKNQYVLDPRTQQVYVLLGDLARDISQADARLPDRVLHAWEPTLPTTARITGTLGTRNLVRGGEKRNRYWADSARASEKDVTATNWMSKIDQLRADSYDAVAGERRLLLRIDYAGDGSELGFFELWTGPKQEDARSPFWVRTEQTRIPSKIQIEQAEQLQKDAKSVLR